MLSESCVCCRSLSHSWEGKRESVEQKPEMKWFLNVWIECSEALTWCSLGGTNCKIISVLQRYSVMAAEASLSRMLNFGLKPLLFKYENMSSKVAMIVADSWLVMARMMMALVV